MLAFVDDPRLARALTTELMQTARSARDKDEWLVVVGVSRPLRAVNNELAVSRAVFAERPGMSSRLNREAP
jgi:hypothetical protein